MSTVEDRSLSAGSRSLVFGMGALWVTWLGIFTIQALLLPFHMGENENVALVIVCVHIVLVLFIFFGVGGGGLALLVVVGFIARVGSMFIDVYAPFNLPITASPDDIRFLAAGARISQDLTLTGEMYGGFYSDFLGHIFALGGVERLTAQYLNVLFGVSGIVFLIVALRLLGIRHKVAIWVTLFAALMPTSVFFSAQLLRESVVQMLVTASVCSFICFFLYRRFWHIVPAIALILFASVFHAGVVALLVGYCLVVALIDVRGGELRFSPRRLVPTLVIAAVCLVPLYMYSDLFLAKFVTLESSGDIIATFNRRAGGSAYLTGLRTDNFLQLILFSPVRAVYFLFSPMPWDWRGVSDVFAFMMDSLIYLGAVGLAVRARRIVGTERMLVWVFTIILVVVVLVFGLGVSNSGTAMRHRSKLAMVFLMLSAVAVNSGAESVVLKARRSAARVVGK